MREARPFMEGPCFNLDEAMETRPRREANDGRSPAGVGRPAFRMENTT
jgi:hypothetical protein